MRHSCLVVCRQMYFKSKNQIPIDQKIVIDDKFDFNLLQYIRVYLFKIV